MTRDSTRTISTHRNRLGAGSSRSRHGQLPTIQGPSDRRALQERPMRELRENGSCVMKSRGLPPNSAMQHRRRRVSLPKRGFNATFLAASPDEFSLLIPRRNACGTGSNAAPAATSFRSIHTAGLLEHCEKAGDDLRTSRDTIIRKAPSFTRRCRHRSRPDGHARPSRRAARHGTVAPCYCRPRR